jgi:hypothetical protein
MPHHDLLLAAFVLSVLAIPWLWFTPSRRPALFVAVYLAITWLQMLLLPNTGATLHHVVLLWPFPQFLVAIALAQLSERAGRRGPVLLASALVILAGSNLLLMNQYYADLTTKGTTAIWTDAISPLYSYLNALQGERVIATDWGYATSLCLLSDGAIPKLDISYVLLDPAPAQKEWLASLVTEPDTVFVNHAPGGEIFAGSDERLAEIAAGRGYRAETLSVIADRNGRPRFRIFRFVPALQLQH